ncbi:hypothetical protein E1176_01260, partial [Fulvivirga sp. RKSG066]|uniref:NADase-type glycan-binding domain-containing protein n=1 Tax=Fulvivirga aurantia TaxID=2529383 RepID=UPI001CA45F7A
MMEELSESSSHTTIYAYMNKLIYLLIFLLLFLQEANSQTPYVIYENFEIKSSEQMYRDPAIGKKYDLKNLVDGNWKTAWVYENMLPEGTAKNDNENLISLTINFPEEVEIEQIQISNGYLKSQHLYQANNRTETFIVKFDDNSKMSLNCKDTFGLQTFTINKKSKRIIIEISNWKMGDKYNDHCISELRIISNDKNLLTPKGYRIENNAGWYSSDVVTFNESNSVDMRTFDAINGLTDPLITNDRKFILYHSNSDGCQI